jgi:membrane fusion protein (multidrug efflux system)
MEMGTRPEIVEQAKARLHAAEGDLATQTLNVQLCTISAPFDGTVTQLPARLGASVEKTVVLATLADLSSVFARVRVPSGYMMQVREGLDAQVTCDAASGTGFAGVVARVGKEADTSSGDVSAYIRIDNPEGALRPGLGCHVLLALSEIAGAIAVPTSAVADRNGAAVVTLIRDGKAYETEVETGIRTSEVVQITKGVSAGDVVATDGGYGLPDGCPVTISNDHETPLQ